MSNLPHPSPASFVHDTARLDQHFLDIETADQIASAATVHPDDVILDVGAGSGRLTTAILAESPGGVIAVEADERCRSFLDPLHRRHPELTIRFERIQDVADEVLAATTVITANPPFSTLEHLTRLLRRLPKLRLVIICVSRPWAEVVTAPIGSPGYGIRSLAIQSRFDADIISLIGGAHFTPAIRRPAALLRLIRRSIPDPGLDLLAETAIQHGGTRVKDLLRSNRLKRTLTADQRQCILRQRTLREMQQRRLIDLTDAQVSELARAVQACLPAAP